MRLPWADIRDTVLVAVACVAAGPLVLAPYNLGVPLCAMALAWLAYRRGMSMSVGVAIGATAALAAVSGKAGLFEGPLLMLVLLVAGPWAAGAMRTRSPWRVVTVLAVVTMASMVAAIAIDQALAGSTLLAFINGMAKQTAEEITRQAGSLGSGGLALDVREIQTMMVQVLPSVFALMSCVAALLAVYGVGWVARRNGNEVRALPPLERMDLSFHLTWVVAAGLLSLAAARFAGGSSGAFAALGWNLMVLVRGALFLQGLAVFAGLYRKAGIGRFGRVLGYVFLGITETVTPVLVPIGLVSIAGLVDLWVNIRKLPRGGASAAEELEEPVGRV
jgi:hypothetical protein